MPMQDAKGLTVLEMQKLDAVMNSAALDNRGFNGKNLINRYTCDACGHVMLTVDRDVGTTPFSLACDREGCKGTATSSMYRPLKLSDEETEYDYEWFRPLTAAEVKAVRRNAEAAARRQAKVYLEGDYAGPYSEEEIYEIRLEDILSHVLRGGLERRGEPAREFRGQPRTGVMSSRYRPRRFG